MNYRRLGEHMDRQYLDAAAELDDARRSGELTDDEYAEAHDALTASHQRAVDTAGENIAEYGHA